MAHSVCAGGCCRFQVFYPPKRAADSLPACRKATPVAVSAHGSNGPHRICGNDRGRRSSRPGRRVRAAGWRTAGPFWGGRYWGRSRRIRLNRSGSCGGMACPRRAGIAYSCGRPAGPMLGRSAGNRPRIPYRDAGRSSSRILRRRRRSLVPCRFRCGPFRTAAVRRCGMLRRTRCAWNSRSSCMGARPIPILHMGNCAAVIYLGVPRSGGAGRSTRRGFRGRSRAGRIAGALGCSGIFAVLCRDNAGRDCSIGTKGRRFFLAACPSALLGGGCRRL